MTDNWVVQLTNKINKVTYSTSGNSLGEVTKRLKLYQSVTNHLPKLKGDNK